MGTKKKIQIYDTTLRDGTQGEGMSLSLEDKLAIAKKLDEFGITYIEGGWPGSNPKDLAFFAAVKKKHFKNAKIAAFGSTRRFGVPVDKDEQVKLLLACGSSVVTIFGKSWDFHVREVFKVSLEENVAMIADTISYLKHHKREVVYDAEHFFDGFRENPAYALKTLHTAAVAGADLLCLCDTNGGSLPGQITEALQRVRKSLPRMRFGIHCHNDSGLAAANSLAAVQAGAVHVQGTVNGYGERCGNADLTTIIPIIQQKLGIRIVAEKDLTRLTELSHFVAEVCNMPVVNGQPFVGASAFAHKGGIHVNAMMKNRRTYEHIKPKDVGNHTRFLISELSGKSNILVKSDELKLGLSKESKTTKTILGKIQDLENLGYQFEAAEASLELLMKKESGAYRKFFTILDARVSAENIGEGSSASRATVKVRAGNKAKQIVAEGDGPIDALSKALLKSLSGFYPVLEGLRLTDYKVRVINSDAGTAAKVRVLIQFQHNGQTWATIGVSENIIEASWQALVDAVEYHLLMD